MRSYLTNLKSIPTKKLLLAAFLASVLIGLSVYSFITLKEFSDTLKEIKGHNNTISRLYTLRNAVGSLSDLSATFNASEYSIQQKTIKATEIKNIALSDLDAIYSMDLKYINKDKLNLIKSDLIKLIDISDLGYAQNGSNFGVTPEMFLSEKIFRAIDSLYSQQVAYVDKLTERSSYELRSLYSSVSFNFLIIGIFIALYYIKSTREAITYQSISESLTKEVNKSDRVINNLSILSELSVFLHAVPDLDKAQQISAQYGEKLFENYSGAYYSLRGESKLGLKFSWGIYSFDHSLEMMDFWAISSKQPLVVTNNKPVQGVPVSFESSYIILPVEVKGKIEGLVIIKANTYCNFEDSFVKLVESYANQVCLGLSNISLRDNLKDLSIKDPLTGLYNRRFMEETLIKYIGASQRNNLNLAVLIIDVDYFKKINDTNGHDGGDYVLKELAETFNVLVRSNDIVCRFGGEEFVIVLYDMDIDDAILKAESIRSVVESKFLQYNNKIISPITVSIGLSCFDVHGKTPDALIKAADTALYTAKNTGRNKVVISS